MKKWLIFLAIAMVLLSGCTKEYTAKQKLKKTAEKNMEKAKFPKIDHIVIVVEENHSRQQIANNPNAPYMNKLMKQGANFTNFYAIEHPSQPNYLDLFSGSNQSVSNDRVPVSKFSTANLASELILKKYLFIGYSEDLPSIGFNGASAGKSGYARKHNPWVNFTNIPKEANQPLKSFPSDYNKLPTVSFVIPTLKHDMHDGTIKEADVWLKNNLDGYVQWAKTHNSLLIVTWDEDEGSHQNKIPTFFVGPMVIKGQYHERLNHFALLRTIEDIYGLGHAGKAKTSKAIINVWKS